MPVKPKRQYKSKKLQRQKPTSNNCWTIGGVSFAWASWGGFIGSDWIAWQGSALIAAVIVDDFVVVETEFDNNWEDSTVVVVFTFDDGTEDCGFGLSSDILSTAFKNALGSWGCQEQKHSVRLINKI